MRATPARPPKSSGQHGSPRRHIRCGNCCAWRAPFHARIWRRAFSLPSRLTWLCARTQPTNALRWSGLRCNWQGQSLLRRSSPPARVLERVSHPFKILDGLHGKTKRRALILQLGWGERPPRNGDVQKTRAGEKGLQDFCELFWGACKPLKVAGNLACHPGPSRERLAQEKGI